jgi:hypothetical protein
MATVRVRGYGGSASWQHWVDSLDPALRGQGWGGGRQWRIYVAPPVGPRLQGNAAGEQWKLHVDIII